LNRCLRLLFRVFNDADDLLGLFDGDALLEGDLLANARAGSGFELPVSESLERDSALDELLGEDFLDGFELVLVGGGEQPYPFSPL
jgi:hypothetical protein